MIKAVRLPDTDDSQHVRFMADVRWVRGVWRCIECQTIQADYPVGGENVLTCGPCPGCGADGEVFIPLELVGVVDGEELDLKEVFLELVTAERSDAG